MLTLPAAACAVEGRAASSPASPEAAPPAPAGVVSEKEAQTVLDQWEKARAAAVRKGGTDWSPAEAGMAAEITTAQSKVNKMIGERVGGTREPIVKPRFAIPARASGEPWFMADFARKGSSTRYQGIYRKTPAGWRLVAMSVTAGESRPPAVARDRNGLATAVAAGDGDGLIASPRRIAQAHARVEGTLGENRDVRRLFAADSHARRDADALRDQRAQLARGRWTTTVRTEVAPEIYALRTSAGGALVWYGLRTRQTFTARPGSTQTLGFKEAETAALSHGKRFTREAVYTSAALYLAVVPRSPGLVRVPTAWHTEVAVTGS
ncbi:hypothetical protein ACIBP6_44590 [Nonomuraea terrae]|uniref:hypothetical protein n=1 Tax=Nonomuraea terrae TaxID=2530383 RepID=UPI0037B8F5E5